MSVVLSQLSRAEFNLEAATESGFIFDFDGFFDLVCDAADHVGPFDADLGAIVVSVGNFSRIFTYESEKMSSILTQQGAVTASLSAASMDAKSVLPKGGVVDAVALICDAVEVKDLEQSMSYRKVLVISRDEVRIGIRPMNHWTWATASPEPDATVTFIRDNIIQ